MEGYHIIDGKWLTIEEMGGIVPSGPRPRESQCGKNEIISVERS